MVTIYPRLSRKSAKSEADVSEMPVRCQDVGDPEFHHNGNGRKIGKRYSWLVRELLSQFDRFEESGLGDFLNVNKRRLNNCRREMPRILEWPALEQVRKCLIQDEIRGDHAA